MNSINLKAPKFMKKNKKLTLTRYKKKLLIMRLTIALNLICTLAFSSNLILHGQTISIDLENVSVKEVFKTIESQTPYRFFYNDELSDINKQVSIKIENKKIENVLDELFNSTEISYTILENNQIVVAPARSMQQEVVSGKITDSSTGEPLPGVNIVEKGTTQGVVTDSEGNYTITVKSSNSILLFSYIGYNSEEIVVGSQTTINVILIPSLEALEEVIVVGYGSMERTNVTGAISTIKTEELSKAPVPNFVEAMRGQIPGIRMTRASGLPGSGVEFLIRGKNSLNNSNEPLIVIDGIPSTGGNLAELNTNDIESINVLKDAAAASIYGARGANGVILIKTKEGQKGKPVLDVNYSQGFTNLIQKPDLMNAQEFVQLKIDAAEGRGLSTLLEDVLDDAIEYANYTHPDGIQEIDWHDILLRTGKVTNLGVSLSGGRDKLTFYLNGNAYLEDGIAQHTAYDRYSFRLNTEYTPYKFMKIGARVQLSKTFADETGNRAVTFQNNPDFTDFLANTPLGRLYDENNELVPTVKGDQFDYNPLYKYRESETKRSTSRVLLNPYIEFTLLKGLTYKINASAEERNERYGRFTSSMYDVSTLDAEPGNNTMTMTHGQPVSYLLDNILTYRKEFAEKHALDVTFVYGIQTFEIDTTIIDGKGSPTDLLSYNSITSSLPSYMNIEYRTDEWRNMYYVGRLSYNYDRRYVITGTARYDGSTVFGPDNQWGFFPSAAFAWNISEESFLENIYFINSLKYRISWGRMGNDRIGTYGYIALTQTASYPFSETVYTGLTSDNLPNESLHWETSQQFNTGLDFGLFNYKLYGSVDVYKTNTIDLILDQLIPSVTGYSEMVSNIGETKNQGIEVILNYRVFDSDFKWEISANWARDRNEIVRLNDAVDEEGNLINDEANGWFIGQDIEEIYDFDFIGIYQLGEEDQAATMHPDKRNYTAGDPKIRDVNGDSVITFEDRTFLGNPTPDWYGGLRNTLSYKGLEFTILFEAVQGVTKINRFYGTLGGRGNEISVDYWTPRNPSNEFPQPTSQRDYEYKDAVRVRDASFIALRNVSLSYTIPGKISQKAKISRLQFYLRGNNLKYFTDYKDAYTPEVQPGPFPITKNWTIGANITF
jgi:TonB-linked SusC/RagA family outer membrane protein